MSVFSAEHYFQCVQVLGTLPIPATFWGRGADVMKQLDPEGKTVPRFSSRLILSPKRPNPRHLARRLFRRGRSQRPIVCPRIHQRAPPRKTVSPTGGSTPNDDNTLHTLANPAFDVHQTVLVADSIPAPGRDQHRHGRRHGRNHAQLQIQIHRVECRCKKRPPSSSSPDRYNPKWQVWVDGKPDRLLRCNFIERGVFPPARQTHRHIPIRHLHDRVLRQSRLRRVGAAPFRLPDLHKRRNRRKNGGSVILHSGLQTRRRQNGSAFDGEMKNRFRILVHNPVGWSRNTHGTLNFCESTPGPALLTPNVFRRVMPAVQHV